VNAGLSRDTPSITDLLPVDRLQRMSAPAWLARDGLKFDAHFGRDSPRYKSLGENSDEFQVAANSLQSVDQVEGYFVEAPRLQKESQHFVNFDRYRDGSDGVTAARSLVPNRHERQAPKTGAYSAAAVPSSRL
jgi:hypothetical protein